MRSCFAPGFRFARRLDGVANVLAVAKRRFPEQTPVPATHFDAVTRIRPRLFATVKLYIGGKQARPDSGYSIEVRGGDRRLLGGAPLCNRQDIRNAGEAARKAEGSG